MTVGTLGSGYETQTQHYVKTQNIEKTERSNVKNAHDESSYNAVLTAYESASRGVNALVSADMRIKLLEDIQQMESDVFLERAMILRAQTEQSLTSENIAQLIGTRNFVLASRGEEPMKPNEEQALINRINAFKKEQIAFLDNFVKELQKSGLSFNA
ncbi:MAG: hypothetical protein LBN32_04630 [Helicobacteraceae bacterium]|jgi:hypothetical protein|nr:hypothetical protein [Helicobacteraceae bacterium]